MSVISRRRADNTPRCSLMMLVAQVYRSTVPTSRVQNSKSGRVDAEISGRRLLRHLRDVPDKHTFTADHLKVVITYLRGKPGE